MTRIATPKWFRSRHLLALMVAAVSGLALLWIVVPGEAVQELWNEGFSPKGGGMCLAFVEYEHGWPFVYLWRFSPEVGRWSFTQHVMKFDCRVLVFDIGVALLIVGLLGGMTFAWMRGVRAPWQFGLSSVFAGFVLVALVLGWWRSLEVGRLGEQALIGRIESFGGTAETGFVGPVWLRKLVGRDSLQRTHRVVRVRLDLDDSDRERLREEGVTPDQIHATIRQLPSFTYCRDLALIFSLVTDEEMATIGRMPCLQVLNLSGSKINDAGLKQLEPLVRLTSLQIENTEITDIGLRSISTLKDLEDLSLAGTKITDKGLEEIGKLRKLQCLNVGGTGVTDEGLRHLVGLAELERVEAKDTGVTAKGARRLKTAMPGVSVDY